MKLLIRNYFIMKNSDDVFMAGRFGIFGRTWLDKGGNNWMSRDNGSRVGSYDEALRMIELHKVTEKELGQRIKEKKRKESFHFFFKTPQSNLSGGRIINSRSRTINSD